MSLPIRTTVDDLEIWPESEASPHSTNLGLPLDQDSWSRPGLAFGHATQASQEQRRQSVLGLIGLKSVCHTP